MNLSVTHCAKSINSNGGLCMRDEHQKVWSYTEITDCAERAIKQILHGDAEHAAGWQNQALAYGIYLGWSQLTEGHRILSDDERLHRLIRAHI